MQALMEHVDAIWMVVFLVAIVIVAFWRTVVRLLMALAFTAIIATLGFGLLMIWQIIHHKAG
jgi:hypothetical protein